MLFVPNPGQDVGTIGKGPLAQRRPAKLSEVNNGLKAAFAPPSPRQHPKPMQPLIEEVGGEDQGEHPHQPFGLVL